MLKTVRAMRAGAFHYLLKPINPIELRETVSKALEEANQAVVSYTEATIAQQRYDRLTPRERDVIALLVECKANKVMGLELGVSQRTVEIHRARVMEKMEASSLADLFRMSLYLELDPPDCLSVWRSKILLQVSQGIFVKSSARPLRSIKRSLRILLSRRLVVSNASPSRLAVSVLDSARSNEFQINRDAADAAISAANSWPVPVQIFVRVRCASAAGSFDPLASVPILDARSDRCRSRADIHEFFQRDGCIRLYIII